MKIDWHEIDIGYQAKATNPEICKQGAPKPAALSALEKTFPKTVRDKMVAGGSIDIPDDTPVDHDAWAATALITLLNKFLVEAGSTDVVTIHPTADFLRFSDPGSSKILATEGKGIDTRCVLRGDKWYSIRSYRISKASFPGQPWYPKKPTPNSPDLSTTIDHMIATLTWECQSVSE